MYHKLIIAINIILGHISFITIYNLQYLCIHLYIQMSDNRIISKYIFTDNHSITLAFTP